MSWKDERRKPSDIEFAVTLTIDALVKHINENKHIDGATKADMIRHLSGVKLDEILAVVNKGFTKLVGTTGDTRTPLADDVRGVVPADRAKKIPKGQ